MEGQFNAHNNFVAVYAGTEAFILEDELNEMQAIQNYKRNLLGKVLTENGFVRKLPLNVTGGILTVPADTIMYAGEVFELFEPMTITVTAGSTIYLSITKELVTMGTVIKDSGNLDSGSTLENTMRDPRINAETTQRIQTQLTLTKTPPSGTYGTGIKVATIGAGPSLDTDYRNSLHVPPPMLSITKSGSDGDFYTVVTYKRGDGTNYMVSTLSNYLWGTAGYPDYGTCTCVYYDALGTTPIKTIVWTLTYNTHRVATASYAIS